MSNSSKHSQNHRQMGVEFATIRIVKGGGRNDNPQFLYIKERGIDFQGKPYSHPMSKKWHDAAEAAGVTFETNDCIIALVGNVPRGGMKDDYTVEALTKTTIAEGRRFAAIVKADTEDLLAAGKSFFDSPLQIGLAVDLGLLPKDTPIPKQTHQSSVETQIAAMPFEVSMPEPKEPLLEIRNGLMNVGKTRADGTVAPFWIPMPPPAPVVKLVPVKKDDEIIGHNHFTGFSVLTDLMTYETVWNEPVFEPVTQLAFPFAPHEFRLKTDRRHTLRDISGAMCYLEVPFSTASN